MTFKRFRLNNLPEIEYDYILTYNYELKDYVKSFTGTIFRRPGTGSAGIMYHYAFLYGVDKNEVIWLISNDKNGVECLCFDDYMENWDMSDLEIEPIVSNVYKEGIMKRAIERSNKLFHLKLNNCERFINYAVYAENDIGWQSKIFDIISKILFLPLDYKVEMSGDENRIKSWNKFKQNIQKPVVLKKINDNK